jgi:hypothetical protein
MDEKEYTAPAIVFAVILIMIVIKAIDSSFRYNDYFPALVTLIAAFVGARAAFSLQVSKQKDDEQTRRTTSLREAQFALSSRINNLLIIHKQYLESQQKNPNRWIELSPILNVTNAPAIPTAELSFLLDAIDPNLLGELVVARDKYDTVRGIISVRNRAHEEYQRVFEQGNNSERLHVQLTKMTNALYDLLPDATFFLHSTLKKIEDIAVQHFKGTNLLRLTPETLMMIDDLQQKSGKEARGRS